MTSGSVDTTKLCLGDHGDEKSSRDNKDMETKGTEKLELHSIEATGRDDVKKNNTQNNMENNATETKKEQNSDIHTQERNNHKKKPSFSVKKKHFSAPKMSSTTTNDVKIDVTKSSFKTVHNRTANAIPYEATNTEKTPKFVKSSSDDALGRCRQLGLTSNPKQTENHILRNITVAISDREESDLELDLHWNYSNDDWDEEDTKSGKYSSMSDLFEP